MIIPWKVVQKLIANENISQNFEHTFSNHCIVYHLDKVKVWLLVLVFFFSSISLSKSHFLCLTYNHEVENVWHILLYEWIQQNQADWSWFFLTTFLSYFWMLEGKTIEKFPDLFYGYVHFHIQKWHSKASGGVNNNRYETLKQIWYHYKFWLKF